MSKLQEAASHSPHPTYRPDIDGLRAIAVLLVVGFHAFPSMVPGGFIGVDIFFVISGFLISTIIYGNLEKSHFSYIEFYSRRIKRIFPALLLVIFSCFSFGWYVLFNNEFSQLGKHISAGAGFVANIAFYTESGYFDTSAELKPLLHLWSLGVEEQFYILWPIILKLVWRNHNKYNFLLVAISVVIVSFLLSIYWIDHDPTANFYLPFSRFWELGIGGILAYILLHKPQTMQNHLPFMFWYPVFGIILLGVSVIFISKQLPFPGWWAVLPTLGAACIIAADSNALINRTILSNRLFVMVGVISYPLYLWHWPLLSFARIIEGRTPSRNIRIIIVLLSILLAWLTYELLEKRFKKAYSRKSITILSILTVILFIVGIFAFKGFIPNRQSSNDIKLVVEAINDWDYPGKLEANNEAGGITFDIKKGSHKKTLYWGDSHLQQYAPRITKLLDSYPNYNTAVFATGDGCIPIPNVFEDKHLWCQDIVQEVLKYVRRDDVEALVIGASWNVYFLKQTKVAAEFTYYYRNANHERHNFSDDSGILFAKKELESFLNSIPHRVKVFLVLDNPSGGSYSPMNMFVGSRFTKMSIIKEKYNSLVPYSLEQKQLNEEMKVIAIRTGAEIIDPTQSLCVENRCKILTQDGRPIYKDSGHLRPFFVEKNASFIDITLNPINSK